MSMSVPIFVSLTQLIAGLCVVINFLLATNSLCFPFSMFHSMCGLCAIVRFGRPQCKRVLRYDIERTCSTLFLFCVRQTFLFRIVFCCLSAVYGSVRTYNYGAHGLQTLIISKYASCFDLCGWNLHALENRSDPADRSDLESSHLPCQISIRTPPIR